MLRIENRTNRTKTDILAGIVDVAAEAGGAIKTHIMYKANLSHGQTEKYLHFLNIHGLIEEIPKSPETGPRKYKTTDKGMGFLIAYKKLAEYFVQPSENQGL